MPEENTSIKCPCAECLHLNISVCLTLNDISVSACYDGAGLRETTLTTGYHGRFYVSTRNQLPFYGVLKGHSDDSIQYMIVTSISE